MGHQSSFSTQVGLAKVGQKSCSGWSTTMKNSIICRAIQQQQWHSSAGKCIHSIFKPTSHSLSIMKILSTEPQAIIQFCSHKYGTHPTGPLFLLLACLSCTAVFLLYKPKQKPYFSPCTALLLVRLILANFKHMCGIFTITLQASFLVLAQDVFLPYNACIFLCVLLLFLLK